MALVVSLNVQRRNLRKDQLAMAAGEASSILKIAQADSAARFGVSPSYVSQAVKLLDAAPDAAAAVKAGKASLTPTYEALRPS